jgi:hypothetical protein
MTAIQTIAGIQYRARSTATIAVCNRNCMICETAFEYGDDYAMVPTRPVDAAETCKAERGETFIAMYEPTHWACLMIRLSTLAGFMRQRAES